MEQAYIAVVALKQGVPVEQQCVTYGVLLINRAGPGEPQQWVRVLGSKDSLLAFARASGVEGKPVPQPEPVLVA